MNNMTTNEMLVRAIMEINRHLRPSIKDVNGDNMVDVLTRIKELSNKHTKMVDYRYGSALGFICDSIISEGWLDVEGDVKEKLIAFAESIYMGITKNLEKAKEERSDAILETIRISESMLSRDGRI